MPNDVPFDVWNGEDLGTVEVVESEAAEETAMHLEPENDAPAGSWSELTDATDLEVDDDRPVSYFADEQPEANDADVVVDADDDPQPDLEVLLERQHYAFPSGANS